MTAERVPINQSEPWKEFFSLTGGSLLYCLSALSIIYGIAQILGPMLAQSGVLCEAIPCLSALHIYELALLGVLVFIVVWQSVTDDAISLVVIGSLFLLGSGLALTTVANGDSSTAFVVGSVGFVLGVGKLAVLRRVIGMSIGFPALAGLAVVLGWNFWTGPYLYAKAAGGIEAAVGRGDWLAGWIILLGGGMAVWLDGQRRWRSESLPDKESQPFLRRRPMLWILAAIILTTATVHQYVLGYVFDIRSAFGDYLPATALIAMLLLQLSLDVRGRAGRLEAVLAAVPLVACGKAIQCNSVLVGWSVGMDLLWYPPVYLAMFGGLASYVAWRHRSLPFVPVCVAYLLGVCLTFGFSPADPLALNWRVTGVLTVVALLTHGLMRRHIPSCALAVVLVTAGVGSTAWFQHLVLTLQMTRVGGLAGVFSLGMLTLGLVFGREMPRFLLVAGAVAFVAMEIDVFAPNPSARDLLLFLLAVPVAGLVWWRTRAMGPVAVILAPFVYRVWLAFLRLSEWRYVLLSFMLLFAGAWMSFRKGRRSRRPPEDGEDR